MVELMQVSNQVAITAANSIHTAPELLTELAGHEDIQVRQAVAGNPNTPTDVLLQLAEEFPQEFVKNPVLPLLQLENPEFHKLIPYSVIQNILACEGAPQEWLRLFATYVCYDYLLAIVHNPQASKQVLQLVAENEYCGAVIHELIELHVNIAGEMKSGWQEYADNKLQYIQDILKSEYYHPRDKGQYYKFTFWELGLSCNFVKLQNMYERLSLNVPTLHQKNYGNY
ncbi:hypothetical protein NIES4101_68260 [Calothrix sp. NIES-4101]|nr:hypothetical protein NIES4101_68260 [Calothrix sp. NIES-4101]